jgi:hypothetical protein
VSSEESVEAEDVSVVGDDVAPTRRPITSWLSAKLSVFSDPDQSRASSRKTSFSCMWNRESGGPNARPALVLGFDDHDVPGVAFGGVAPLRVRDSPATFLPVEVDYVAYLGFVRSGMLVRPEFGSVGAVLSHVVDGLAHQGDHLTSPLETRKR